MQFDRERDYVNNGDPAGDAGLSLLGQRESVLASIKAALVTSQLTLSVNDAGVDPYNSRLGKRPRSAWNGHRR